MARKRIFAGGRVQGVSYRAGAADEAMRLGLRGWVRNRKDGQVEALVEGEPAAIECFVEWCRKGSSGARVQSVTAKDDVSTDALGPFEVRPTV
ncbi:MAG: acylphosphatase [Planctomycetota bacterium]